MARAGVAERRIPDELEPQLAERVARAAAVWPHVTVGEQVFVRAIALRLDDDAPVRALGAMHTDDLYLVCGCAAGDLGALAGFDAHCGSTITRAIATTVTSRAERADLEQIVRQRLLVAPEDGRAPRIATYSARGPLRNWVRVVATREVARMLPRARREVSASDDDLASVIARDDDPEISYLKRLYREEFKHAFHSAVEALGPRDRLVLQQHALDGLSIDQLADLHRIHRATAARWVQAARAAVLAGTERDLVQRLRLSRSELASVIRLIQSQLDITIPILLRSSA